MPNPASRNRNRTKEKSRVPLASLPVVLCPGCKTAMKPSPPRPLCTSGLSEIVYTCESCGTSTTRLNTVAVK